MSFGNVTSEVTDFSIDPGIFLFGLVAIIAVQLLKNNSPDLEEESNEENVRRNKRN